MKYSHRSTPHLIDFENAEEDARVDRVFVGGLVSRLLTGPVDGGTDDGTDDTDK